MQIQSATIDTTTVNCGKLPKQIDLAPGLSLPCAILDFDRNAEIFAEEEEASFVYKVVRGAVRDVRLLSDGRRQIGAFHLADAAEERAWDAHADKGASIPGLEALKIAAE